MVEPVNAPFVIRDRSPLDNDANHNRRVPIQPHLAGLHNHSVLRSRKRRSFVPGSGPTKTTQTLSQEGSPTLRTPPATPPESGTAPAALPSPRQRTYRLRSTQAP